MNLDFKEITIDDKELFDNYYKKQPQYSGYTSFVTLFTWRKKVKYEFAVKDSELLVRFFFKPENKFYFFVVQNDKNSLKKAVDILKKENEPLRFYNATGQQKKIFEELYADDFFYKRNRDSDNYIYLSEKLASLSGKKLHSKKNHLNKFRKTYSYTYEKITTDNVDECIDMLKSWCDRKCSDSEDGSRDLCACEEALLNMEKLGLKGGAIRVNNKIIAFSIGELLNSETALIHFEKADIDYQGSFTAINCEFVNHEWKNVKYINREEDMGIEGLRKSKMSYYPVKMLETYIITENE